MDIPETIKQLDQWMKNNCYRNDSYAIAGRRIYEGYGLKKKNNRYIWYYTERGQEQDLNQFDTETEAVTYAYDQIKNDKYADRHMIAFVSNKLNLSPLYNDLNKQNINYFTDELFYAENDYRTRIFVFGCDIKKVNNLKIKYKTSTKNNAGIYSAVLIISGPLLCGLGYGGTSISFLGEIFHGILFYTGLLSAFIGFLLFMKYLSK